MGKPRCLPHSDHRGARCAPVTLRSLLWRNLRQTHHCGTMQASSPTNHVQRSQHTARQNSSAVAFTPILYKGKCAFQHAEKKSDLYFPVNRALHFYVMLRQHRTIPALRLKHHSGSCGMASALPKCSIMSGCGTRIVLRGQKPLALCDRCPCFGSLFPPLAALTFAASSIICAFGLASAAPRSPYRHLELCGIALTKPAKTGELNASCRAAFESNIILL